MIGSGDRLIPAACERDFAERLDLRAVVGNGGVQELLGAGDQAAQLLGKTASGSVPECGVT